MNPLDQLEDEVKASSIGRVVAAEKWTSCIALCVFLICGTALVLGLVALLHG